MKRSIGIILKKYQPKKRTISILDKDLGKIKCLPNAKEVVLGSLVTYFVKKSNPLFIIDSIEILHIPFDTAIDDILFLHHVLEVCYNFIPSQCPSGEIFDHIKYLYFYSDMIKCNIDKKIFLFKLFTFLGLYPENIKFQTPYFNILATKSIDTIISKKLHLKGEIEIDQWLHCCIAMQPEFSDFKTINFLKAGCHE